RRRSGRGRNRRWRAGAADALDGERSARQGRAGEGRQRKLNRQPLGSELRNCDVHVVFTRWKAVAILLTAFVVCLCAVPNFFPESKVKNWPAWAQRHVVLGLDLQR